MKPIDKRTPSPSLHSQLSPAAPRDASRSPEAHAATHDRMGVSAGIGPYRLASSDAAGAALVRPNSPTLKRMDASVTQVPAAIMALAPVSAAQVELMAARDVSAHAGIVATLWGKHPFDEEVRYLGYTQALVRRYGDGLSEEDGQLYHVVECMRDIDSALESRTLAQRAIDATTAQIDAQPFLADAFRSMLPVHHSIVEMQESILAVARPRLMLLSKQLPSNSPLHASIETYNLDRKDSN